MTKLLFILLIGLVFEATGVVLLKKGINQLGEMKRLVPGEVFRVIKSGITNPTILLGVVFEAIFFASLLILMSRSDISFLWPLTALSFVMTTFAALLEDIHEHFETLRQHPNLVLRQIGSPFADQGPVAQPLAYAA